MGAIVGGSTTERTYERPIVVRTRLLEVLERVQQRTVLLVAPAGYGKTTLARQWIERVGGAWVAITPASADVPVLARDVAAAIGSFAEMNPSRIESALAAGRTPAEQAVAVSTVIQSQIAGPIDLWIVLDDYHLLGESPAAEELVARLEHSGRFRFLVTSRQRPAWATSRRRVYMDIFEFGAPDLALDELEVAQVLPPDRRTVALRKQARGWPALIALGAHAQAAQVELTPDVLAATLYEYFAEELFDGAPTEVRACLTTLAVSPQGRAPSPPLRGRERLLAQVVATGLAYVDGGVVRVHPLAREFLLTKFRERPDARQVATEAFEAALEDRAFDDAFWIATTMELDEYVERLIVTSYSDLVANGRITALHRFGNYAATRGAVSRAVLGMIDADIAIVQGQYDRAESLAVRVVAELPARHDLRPRAFLVAGRSAQLAQRPAAAMRHYTDAQQHAATAPDVHEATWGKCLAAITLEDDMLGEVLHELESLPVTAPTQYIRVETARIYSSLLGDTAVAEDRPGAAEVVANVPDPWVRTGYAYVCGTRDVIQGRYEAARTRLRSALTWLDEYGLSFGMPNVEWSLAAAELGLRHFARAEALLRKVERHENYSRTLHHQLNARALRARLEMAQQRPEEAVAATADDFDIPADGEPNANRAMFHANRAMYGEYLATRALALAVCGRADASNSAAEVAGALTRTADVRVLIAASAAVNGLNAGDDTASIGLAQLASRLDVWDGVVCAIRAVPELLNRLSAIPEHRARLREVLLCSNDVVLAKSAGLITRSAGMGGRLSPREREIMDHVRQGKRNAEIAASLFIAVGTVKRHLDHIYTKLGARGRAEAIARYAEIESAETGDVGGL